MNPETGRREEQYEIPYLAIREAVSNAVAHRDYRIPGNIDVAIFDNRVEVWSPGSLPRGVTIRDIKSKKRFSVPRNPVVSEALFLTGNIEKWGSGIMKMNTFMIERGLATPEYEECFGGFLVTFHKKKTVIKEGLKEGDGKFIPEVTEHVKALLTILVEEKSRPELQELLGIKHRPHFMESYINPALNGDFIEMTIPDKPKSRLQKYRLTDKGRRFLARMRKDKKR